MDLSRLVLMSALAVVTYLLILAWNEDYGQQPVATPARQTAAPLEDNAGDLPSIPADDQRSQDDLPTAQPATAAPAARTSNQLIHVETDVLQVQIDPRGGDLVHIALKQYRKYIDQPDNPFLLLQNNEERTYVAQSGLIGRDGPDAAAGGRPLYNTEQYQYRAQGDGPLLVDLHFTTAEGVKVTKRFKFAPNRYLIEVEYLIENNSAAPWQASLFGQLKRDNSPDPTSGVKMGLSSYLGAALTTTEERYKKVDFDEEFRTSRLGGWIAILQHYFVSAWVPAPDQTHTYQVRRSGAGQNLVGFVAPPLNVAPGENGSVAAQLYAGPKIQERLKQVAPALELTVDYGWLWFIGQPLFWLLSFFHDFVGNWGWAIVLTTLVVKLAFYKLSATSYRSMANMRRVAPMMQRMKEQYGDDRQKMSAALMELYKKEKINPLGGCLPILVQMPVFIALYWVLLESVELRHAPFILWINDLAVMDPYFILPILMGVSMFVMQMLSPAPPDPMQAKVMKLMPVIFTFFFLWFPAGLVLYWVVNNILSIAQQWYITRQIENAPARKT